jgi:DNA-binding CsgD family transcriptional regulator
LAVPVSAFLPRRWTARPRSSTCCRSRVATCARIAPRASAALFITPAPDGSSAPSAALAALFDLSPAEIRTVERIIAGDTLAEAAAKLGIAVTTVRTHLAHIFEKTGTSRQAELIRLAAKFAPPIVAPGA